MYVDEWRAEQEKREVGENPSFYVNDPSNVQWLVLSNVQRPLLSNVQRLVPSNVQRLVPSNVQRLVLSNVQRLVPSNVQRLVPSNVQRLAFNGDAENHCIRFARRSAFPLAGISPHRCAAAARAEHATSLGAVFAPRLAQD
jgi:hypothetical protein